jgi:Zn-dependent protease with chaperone function
MMDILDCYPPPPADVPPSLTRPSPSYRIRVLVVLSSLFLFVALYVGLVVGLAYLCYYCFAGPPSAQGRTSAGFWGQVDGIALENRQVLNVSRDAENRFQAQAIDEAQFVQIIERDVLPPWRNARQRLAQITDVPRDESRRFELLKRYMALCEEGWELACQALRQNDPALQEQARQRMQQADQLARQNQAAPVRYSSRRPDTSSDWTFWRIILGIASGVLCLFLVKGFFKRRRDDRSLPVEVTEKDQPVLFAFLRRLCRDTRAPLPRHVYVTPEVNAAVFYNESFLSLFLPTRKNLLIGLGLVNRLNLSELKAVLAHEFGHFSQSSMKLGSYVYTSNRVIGDLVYGRDWLDDLVATLRGVDIRIAVFAWAFTGVLWAVRKTLQGVFRVINFANSALSRQMEYNADLVAVSVTGSDALVHGLARLDLATDSLGQAWNDLTAAADHNLYSRDLFYHQTRAAEYLRALRKNPRLGEPPALPADPHQATQVFPPEDTSVPRMWATHPTNHDRETNAKRHYIRSPLDERSPWVLFQGAAALRETVTRQLYQAGRRHQQLTLEAPEVVQAFIDDEHAETTYHPRYHGLYDHRYVTPGDLDELARASPAAFAGAEQVAEAHARLYGDDIKERMEAHQARQEERNLLARLTQGAVQLTGKDFHFRGARYGAADAKPLLDRVQKEIDQDFDWMNGLDRESFLVHYAMAAQVGEAERRELEERYRFHLAVQGIHSQLVAHHQDVQFTLAQLAGRRRVSQAEFQGAVAVFRNAHDALAESLGTADQLHLPALKNMTPGAALGPFLLNQPLIYQLHRDQASLDGDWIGRFLGQLGEVLDKTQRIHFKSLGGILALQETVAERWAALRVGQRVVSQAGA